MSETVKETKAQRAERLKRELNPWEAFEEIRRFAREGHASIPPEWGTYFRWWGVYSQGDGVGAVGGRGGEGKSTPYFMVRIRIPNGALAAHQVRAIADLAERHARGVADLTVRQNVQLHWVTIEDLPTVLETLWRTGITTLGACGDVTRNVTGCPVAGVDADELVDASPLVHAATRMLNGNPDFYNLPRKYKVTITGCRSWCVYPEINDLGLTAVRHPGTGEVGFSVRIGRRPVHRPAPGSAARRLRALAGGVAGRARRVGAVPRQRCPAGEPGEGAAQVPLPERRLDRGALPGRAGAAPRLRAGPGGGRGSAGRRLPRSRGHPSAAAGRSLLRRVARPSRPPHARSAARGRLTGRAFRLGRGAYDDDAEPDRARRAARSNGGPRRRGRGDRSALEASPFRRGTVACTGSEFCKLALTETKGFARKLVSDLETRLPGFDRHVRIHVTGCPNSCGQHWIADIGIEGKKLKVDGALVDAYYFCVGGAVGLHASVARPVGYRVAADEVPAAIERLLRRYLDDRAPGEPFRGFCARHTDAELREMLAGGLVPVVERDVPAGRPPHGVEG